MSLRTHFQDVDGVRTRYLRAGDGKRTVLLIHGLGVCAEIWIRNIEALAGEFTVVAPDLLSHGYTDHPGFGGVPPQLAMARHLWALLDQIGVTGPVHVVGSSIGGLIAGLMYFERPRQVDALVFVAAPGLFPGPAVDGQALRASLANGGAAQRDPTLDNCRRRLENIVYRPGDIPAELVWAQVTYFAFEDRLRAYEDVGHGLAESFRAPEGSLTHRVADIAARCLLITGREDIRAPVQLQIDNVHRLPSGQLIVYNECGHMPFTEYPDRFNSEVLAFLSAS